MKYYYKIDPIGKGCMELCKIQNIGIGSQVCKDECEYCSYYDEKEEWIDCLKIDRAVELKPEYLINKLKDRVRHFCTLQEWCDKRGEWDDVYHVGDDYSNDYDFELESGKYRINIVKEE